MGGEGGGHYKGMSSGVKSAMGGEEGVGREREGAGIWAGGGGGGVGGWDRTEDKDAK